MPSRNKYNTRSQMTLNISLCRASKGQKCMSFLGSKIVNKLTSNIRMATTTASLTQVLKKETLEKLQ